VCLSGLTSELPTIRELGSGAFLEWRVQSVGSGANRSDGYPGCEIMR